MARRALARLLVVAALAVFGILLVGGIAAAQTDASGSNAASSPEATSGDASGDNQATAAQAGPSTQQGGAGARDIEDTAATVVHEGDNEVEVSQTSKARSGDAVAGSQVTGVVSHGGSVSVRKSNWSEDAEATSGDAEVTNTIGTVFAGPIVIGEDGAVVTDITDVAATIAHEGDNEVEFTQDGLAETGDAVAGSQVDGIVAAHGADVSVDNTNVSEDAEAESGDADVTNDAPFVFAGPVVAPVFPFVPVDEPEDVPGPELPPAPAPLAVAPPAPVVARDIEDVAATIVHEGDNELEASQSGSATSGDAVAGSQVLGLVASEVGSVSVVMQQASEDADAESGDAETTNTFFLAFAGPTVIEPVVEEEPPPPAPLAADIEDVAATIAHEGDNEVEFEQLAASESGDAVAGSTIVGIVSKGGDVAVVTDNTAEDAEADSGDADASNDTFEVTAGPAVEPAPEPVLEPAPPTAADIEDVAATIAHEGDNEVEFSQDASATSGDAVAGGTVIGIVNSGGDVSVDATNVSEDAEADSGDAEATNDVDTVFAGPTVIFLPETTEEPPPPPLASDITDVAADIAHEGDNEVELAQTAGAETGDAVAGGQVIGVVNSGGDVEVVASNTSEDDEADSGDATATNDAPFAFAGPTLVPAGFVFFVPEDEVVANDIEDVAAAIAHEGDNELTLDQSAGAVSGDAVAGGQVMGIVNSGGDVSVDATNVSEDSEADSGDAEATNDVDFAFAGPIFVFEPETAEFTAADITDVAADIAHEGDNELELGQTAGAESGDAVAGAQVIGVVADDCTCGSGGNVDIVASNTSEDAEATSGDVTATNDVFAAFAGPIVVPVDGFFFGGTAPCDPATDPTCVPVAADIEDVAATIAHEGDNELELDQSAGAASGDAVAGGQVMGVVASGGSVSIDASNVSEDAEAESGDVDALNTVFTAFAGPIVVVETTTDGGLGALDIIDVASTIAHEGENELGIGQDLSLDSGDAVAGGQVIGVVGSGGDVDIVQDNASEDDESTSGDTDGTSDLFFSFAGPIVVPTGFVFFAPEPEPVPAP